MALNVSPKAAPTPTQPGATRLEQTFKTNQSPSMRDKIAAAQKAPPPPAPAAQTAAPTADATARKTIGEGSDTTAEATPAGKETPQLAVLAQKERQLRKAQAELEAREAAIKAQEADYIPKERLTKETLKVLAEAGITYEKLTEMQLGEAAVDPQEALLNRIAELEARVAETPKTLAEQEQKRNEQARANAVAAIQNDVELLVSTDPAFETIKATGKTRDVTELIEKVFDTEGVMLTVEDAARQIEDLLVEETIAQVQKLSQLEKIKAKLGTSAETAQAGSAPTGKPPEKSAQQRASQTKTLTNNLGVQRPLSARERAIAAFEAARSK